MTGATIIRSTTPTGFNTGQQVFSSKQDLLEIQEDDHSTVVIYEAEYDSDMHSSHQNVSIQEEDDHPAAVVNMEAVMEKQQNCVNRVQHTEELIQDVSENKKPPNKHKSSPYHDWFKSINSKKMSPYHDWQAKSSKRASPYQDWKNTNTKTTSVSPYQSWVASHEAVIMEKQQNHINQVQRAGEDLIHDASEKKKPPNKHKSSPYHDWFKSINSKKMSPYHDWQTKSSKSSSSPYHDWNNAKTKTTGVSPYQSWVAT